MDSRYAVLSIAVALALGAVSPGPSFLLVARTALAVSRRHGLAVAVGMGLGGALFAIAALAGLNALFLTVPSLFAALKVLGGAYLIFLGYRIWRGAADPIVVSDGRLNARTASILSAFGLGLVTQISNPKTALVYASVFASLLPQDLPTTTVAVLPVLTFAIETGWYCVVAVALSSAAPRGYYLGAKIWIDRAAAGNLSALGAKLILDARSP